MYENGHVLMRGNGFVNWIRLPSKQRVFYRTCLCADEKTDAIRHCDVYHNDESLKLCNMFGAGLVANGKTAVPFRSYAIVYWYASIYHKIAKANSAC